MAKHPTTDEEWRDRIWAGFAKEVCDRGYAPRCLRALTYPVLVPATPDAGLLFVPDVDVLGVSYTVSFEPGEAPFVHISAIRIRDENGDTAIPEELGKQMAEGLINARTRSIKEGRIETKVLN